MAEATIISGAACPCAGQALGGQCSAESGDVLPLIADQTVDAVTAMTNGFTSDDALAEVGRARAERYVRAAIPKASGSLQQGLALTLNKLDGMRVLVPPPGYDFVGCSDHPDRLAATDLETGEVMLCRRVLKTQSSAVVTQAIIHEAAHVAGVRDECRATAIEYAAMKLGGSGLAFENGYACPPTKSVERKRSPVKRSK